MVEFRRVLPEEMEACIALTSICFPGERFREQMPKAYAFGNEMEAAHFAAFDDGVPVALTGVLLNHMVIGNDTLKYGFIGSVCVHPDHRGKNYMKSLMTAAIDFMHEQGCQFSLLGGLRQRYGYFGFEYAGSVTDYTISSANRQHALPNPPSPKIRFEEMRGEHVPAVKEIHDAQPMHADRPAGKFITIMRICSYIPVVIYRGGDIIGWLCSSPDHAVLSELVLTDLTALQDVLAIWMDSYALKSLKITVPCFAMALNHALCAFAEDAVLHHCVNMAVYDYSAVLSACLKLKASLWNLADGDLPLRIGNRAYTLSLRGGFVSVSESCPPDVPSMTDTEAVCSLFFPAGSCRIPHAPAGWLPLPFSLTFSDDF